MPIDSSNNPDKPDPFSTNIPDPYGVVEEKKQLLDLIDQTMAEMKAGKLNVNISYILMVVMSKITHIGDKMVGMSNASSMAMGKLQSALTKLQGLIKNPGSDDSDQKVNDISPYTGDNTDQKVTREVAIGHILTYMQNTLYTPYQLDSSGNIITDSKGKKRVNPLYVFAKEQYDNPNTPPGGDIASQISSSINLLGKSLSRPDSPFSSGNIDNKSSTVTGGASGFRHDSNGNLEGFPSWTIPPDTIRNIWDASTAHKGSKGTFSDPNTEPLKSLQSAVGSTSQQFTSSSGSVTAIQKTYIQVETTEEGTLSKLAQNIASTMKAMVGNQKVS